MSPKNADNEPSEKDKTKPAVNQNHPGKCSIGDFPSAEECHHHHDFLKPGDLCPKCLKCKIKDARPRQQILFEGFAPLRPVIHISHDLICGLCGEKYRATPSKKALDNGLGSCDRYGHSAVAMIVVLKYFSALPWNRISRLQGMFNIKLSPSSQFDQSEKQANTLKPIQDLEKFVAAQSDLFIMDDTSNRVLDKTQQVKLVRGTGKYTIRDGCHSSLVIAFNVDGYPIVQVKTDIIHAGEWIDNILLLRSTDLADPLVSGDCISSNKVTTRTVNVGGCNQHARQKFYDKKANGPNIVKPILEWYKQIFIQDTKTRDMTPRERLESHQRLSAPIMDNIVAECRRLIDEKVVTPNSDLGGACQYILNHEPALRAFHTYEKAPLSTNLVERIIGYIVILRKNVHFFKTTVGAAVGDTLLSVGLTAFLAGTNIFEYFRLASIHRDEVRTNPEAWTPWEFNKRYPEHVIEYPDRKRPWPPKPGSPYISPGLELTGCPEL